MTYIKTAALYLMIVLAAETLTASPATAVGRRRVVGLVRGLAVLLWRGITSTAALAAFHGRFTAAGPVVLSVVVACELATALAFAAVLSPWAAVALALLGAAGAVDLVRRRTLVAAGDGPCLTARDDGVDADRDDPHDDAAVAGRVVSGSRRPPTLHRPARRRPGPRRVP